MGLMNDFITRDVAIKEDRERTIKRDRYRKQIKEN